MTEFERNTLGQATSPLGVDVFLLGWFFFFGSFAWNGARFKLHKCYFNPRFASGTAAFPFQWQWSCLMVFVSPSAQRLLYWDDFSQVGCVILPAHSYRSFWWSWDALAYEAFATRQRCWQQSLLHRSLWLEERHSWKGPKLMFSILPNLRSSFAWACVYMVLHSQSLNFNVLYRGKIYNIFSLLDLGKQTNSGSLFTKSAHFLMERDNYVIKITFTSFWNLAKLYLHFFVNLQVFKNVFPSSDFTITGEAGSFQCTTFNACELLWSFQAQITAKQTTPQPAWKSSIGVTGTEGKTFSQ